MRPRVLIPLAAAAASGVLLWLASPAVGFGALAWVALVPAAAASLALRETRLGRAALPLAGLLLYALRFPQPLRLPGLGTARGVLAAVFVPATLWAALDLLRTKIDPGGLWGPLSLSQADGPGAGLGALAGPWLVTFLLVAASFALAAFVVSRRSRVLALPAFVVAVLAGAALLNAPDGSSDERVRVAAVQPGYDTAEFDRPVNRYLRRAGRDLRRASLDLARDLAPLTEDAAARGAEVVVWPEATIWVDPAADPIVRAHLGRVAREADAVLVVPYFLRGPDHGAAALVLPDGSVTRAQPKQRPMWFLGERGGNRVAAEPVEAGGLTVGTMLGVDAQDPASARRLAARGAGVVASSTHDWAALARQQTAQARLAAAAAAVPIVRADWRYGSAIVAPDGSLLAHAGYEKRRTVLVADVPTAGAVTGYRTVGDVPGWIAVAAAVALCALGAVGRLRGERPERERAAYAVAEPEPAAHPPP